MSDTKIAVLKGLDSVKFFPIITNTTTSYSVGEGFELPWVQSITREVESETKPLYGDNKVYANAVNFKGIKATFTFLGSSFELLEKLGYGKYDIAKKEFTANPQGEGKDFAVSFRALKLDNSQRMFKFFNFIVSSVKESEIKTQGMSDPQTGLIIEGTFTTRAIDDKMNIVKDAESSADYTWLNTVETLPPTETRKTTKE